MYVVDMWAIPKLWGFGFAILEYHWAMVHTSGCQRRQPSWIATSHNCLALLLWAQWWANGGFACPSSTHYILDKIMGWMCFHEGCKNKQTTTTFWCPTRMWMFVTMDHLTFMCPLNTWITIVDWHIPNLPHYISSIFSLTSTKVWRASNMHGNPP